MKKTIISLLLIAGLVFAKQKVQTARVRIEQPHHHKTAGVVMIVGGVVLAGVGAFTLSRPCPAQQRAQQIGATAATCGPSWSQQHKVVVGASATGIGAALVISGVAVLHGGSK